MPDYYKQCKEAHTLIGGPGEDFFPGFDAVQKRRRSSTAPKPLTRLDFLTDEITDFIDIPSYTCLI